jgi:hypothetical protein
MSRTKRRKFDALFELYQQMRNDPAHKHLSHQDLCEKIVLTQAPEWFLHYDAAALILQRQRKLRNEIVARRYGR